MSRFDRRIDHTLELICLGGSGVHDPHDNAGCCAAEWVSSVVGTLAKVREFVPRLAEIDVLASQLPFFVSRWYNVNTFWLSPSRPFRAPAPCVTVHNYAHMCEDIYMCKGHQPLAPWPFY